MPLLEIIKSKLHDKINIQHLEIIDESHKHANHTQSNGGHFKVSIVSNDFKDINLIGRHKMIYSALGNLIKTKIHAISISAKTSDE
tara:strand:- start:967 stop:1224 length:258 start_codon:yes stop_codon:yes gene_type:complete